MSEQQTVAIPGEAGVPDDMHEHDRRQRLRYYRSLIDKVATDQYPSTTHMNMIEEGLPEELYDDYVNALIEKTFSVRYPSTSLLERVQRLVGSAR